MIQIDWDGYTIGYYGRIFEARNKTKGGSFVVRKEFPFLFAILSYYKSISDFKCVCYLQGDDKDFFKFRLGSGEVRTYALS